MCTEVGLSWSEICSVSMCMAVSHDAESQMKLEYLTSSWVDMLTYVCRYIESRVDLVRDLLRFHMHSVMQDSQAPPGT